MLEASDDLTNLSHLNEPAGMPFLPSSHPMFTYTPVSPASHQAPLRTK